MTHTWDPDRYLTYADERGRPFVELVARIAAPDPRSVVDLGCGPGNLTALLAERWPDAEVVGIDSSPEMIAKARGSAAASRVAFDVGDVRDWSASADGVDVLVSNATLQWLPDHLELLPRLVAQVRPGGWFAFQVPGNFDQPSHTIRAELAAEEPYAGGLETVARATSSTTGGAEEPYAGGLETVARATSSTT
ncbi:methyltransferase domain-containing protein, partial [Nocardioides pelophilus]|uniref:methyltransferase domain-containing protein n=1 Tax=Nocardioides pelophilus TaxID=2172019 RepID=UPI0016035C7A